MFEVDVTDKNPLKFWTAATAIVATLTGGSGAVSYSMAQEATKDTAEAVARETVRGLMDAYEAETDERLEDLQQKVEDNGTKAAEIGRDIDWIRRSLERMERRQYEDADQS